MTEAEYDEGFLWGQWTDRAWREYLRRHYGRWWMVRWPIRLWRDFKMGWAYACENPQGWV